MSGAHLHLLVNHAPILGSIFALALLLASFVYAPEVLRRTALVVLVGTAVASGVANASGDPAEDAIRGFPGVRREVIQEHEETAERSFTVAGVLGLLALGALIRWRRTPLPRGIAIGALAGAALVSVLMVYTGLLGGRIRHTEVRPGATTADAAAVEPAPTRPPDAPR